MDKVIVDYLKELGCDTVIDEKQEQRVKTWLDEYKGKTKDYIKRIYNGKRYIKYEVKTLGLPAKVCEDLADFFFNEKLDITISKKSVNDKIQKCLEQNKFIKNSNKLLQLVKALGTGAYVPYLDNNVLRINYVNATNIIILSATAESVQDVLFYDIKETQEGLEYRINTHILEDDGYVIYNKKMILKDKQLIDIDLGETAEIHTKSMLPQFAVITTPEVNNKDIDSPYGISCYANAWDEVVATDTCFDSMYNEVYLGKKRVYVKQGAMNIALDDNGQAVPVFDPDDVLFYSLPGDDDNKELVKESTADLRVEEISQALQYNLNLVSSKVGLGQNFYKFKDGQVYVNTENIMASNSEVFRKIKKQENILTDAINDLIYAIAYLIGIKDKFTISVFYDDSIIENTEKIQKQAQTEYNMGLISMAQYYRDVYGLKDQEAEKFAQQMIEERNKEQVPDITEYQAFGM